MCVCVCVTNSHEFKYLVTMVAASRIPLEDHKCVVPLRVLMELDVTTGFRGRSVLGTVRFCYCPAEFSDVLLCSRNNTVC